MKSKFKHLVTSGCSFTHQPEQTSRPFSWANLLADYTGMQIHNLAIPGAGNDHISQSIILYLKKNKIDPKETLVLPMWSGISRIDWITDSASSQFAKEYPFSYHYDNYNELVLGGAWWNVKKPSPIIKTLVEYSKYQSGHSLALRSWLAMENLSNYLIVNNYTYYYTSFINYKRTGTGAELLVNFDDELSDLNILLDKESWLPLYDNEYYGDWSRHHRLLDSDNFHPKFPEANEGWVQTILMPHLLRKDALHE
jgi:hypothetical protein